MSSAINRVVAIFLLVILVTIVWYKWSSNNSDRWAFDPSTGNRLMVVNVLNADQYRDCHIKGSINVPFNDLERFAQRLAPETELVFYCSNYRCSGSGAAAKLFQSKGFKKVWAYEAGMAEWYQRGLPSEGPCKSNYLRMDNPSVADHDEDIATISTDALRAKLGF